MSDNTTQPDAAADQPAPTDAAPTPTTLATPAESVGLACRLLSDAMNVPLDEVAWIKLDLRDGSAHVQVARTNPNGQGLVGQTAGPFHAAQVSE